MPDTPVSLLKLRMSWKGEHLRQPLEHLAKYHTAELYPSDEYPFGRKGLTLARIWQHLSADEVLAGILILDGDVAIDPHDSVAMDTAIEENPDDVHIAPVKLWPKATGFDSWVWGHGWDGWTNAPVISDQKVNKFGFSFTWLPARLIEACIAEGLEEWGYPTDDQYVSATAQKYDIPCHLVAGCFPKHVNF